MKRIRKTVIAAGLAACLAGGTTLAQGTDFSAVEIVPHEVQGTFHYLEGAGGNIGVSIGEDGVVMVDDQFAPLSEKIVAAVRTLSEGPIRIIVNTHIHGDHNGGNENFAAMGIPIMSHDNVRSRIITDSPDRPESARPILTFGDGVSLHLNGETINVIKVPPAHTDGDSIVHFVDSDVIHTGDVFRTTGYPGVDAGNGGTVQGTIDALDMIIDLAGPGTRIVPGHGTVASRDDVVEFRAMVIEVRRRLSDLLDQGMSTEQIVAANATADLDERWGSFERFLPGFVQALAAER
jgi:glyoxylase-like metal-dependent hydrolase (beta-lactamase superfamily II)